jgi:hypothetical protein
MTCVLCLYVNPPALHQCLRCKRAVLQPAFAFDDDSDRVSFDPVFQLPIDANSGGHQPTELFGTLDFFTDPTPPDGISFG